MKKILFILSLTIVFSLAAFQTEAQCSICTKTVMQLGDKPAKGFNDGILYLMTIPYLVVGAVGYKWWQNEKRRKSDS
ncbi:MAG: hypothetical protein ACTHNG_14005 [Ginsengibacter sp.]